MTVWGDTSVSPTRTSASVLKPQRLPPQNNFAQSGQTTTGCDVSCDLWDSLNVWKPIGFEHSIESTCIPWNNLGSVHEVD